MTSDAQRLLDPDRVAKRGFSNSFRGFDQDEVRSFLEQLADALRSSDDDRRNSLTLPEAEKLRTERDQLKSSVADLEKEVAQLIERARQAEERTEQLSAAAAAAAEIATVPTEVDEAMLTQFLGQETVRVLETARAAAHNITSRSEADAQARATAMDERVAAVEAELSRRQSETDATLAELRSTTEEEVARLRSEVEESTTTLRQVAEKEALDLREKASADVSELRAEAEKSATELRGKAEADAARIMREAETDAARIRNESAADALAAQDAAREQARLMLHEAQSVREKVLADLVKRRRAGRQQLDQVKAARDRLARSLAVVRKDLDEAMSELVAAVPEARAAMEAVGRRVPESADARKAAELAAELDSARPAGATVVDTASIPDIDALFDRLRGDAEPASEGPDSPGSDSAGSDSAGSDSAGSDSAGSDSAGSDSAGDGPVDAGGEPADDEGESAEVTASSDEVAEDPIDLIDVVTADDDDIDGVDLIDGKPSTSPVREPAAPPDDADAMAKAARARVVPDSDSEIEPTDTAEAPARTETGDDDVPEENGEQIDLPDAFIERDVTMTRLGPDLRRQLKRALADDQSIVLDGLRQVRKTITSKDLPPRDQVIASYRAAFEGPLRAAADNGAELVGGKRPEKAVNELLDRVARALAEPLRDRVERAIDRVDGDKTEVLDPIRAQYRDARATELPGIADDALAEAFALGAYHGLKDGTTVIWVPDPRSEPGPDCFDNTLAGAIVKPEPFPTGHRLPLGAPGCRCLVLATH